MPPKAPVSTEKDPFAESNALYTKWTEHEFSPTDAADIVMGQSGVYNREVRRALEKGWIKGSDQNH